MVARVYHGSQSTTQLTGTSWTFWLMFSYLFQLVWLLSKCQDKDKVLEGS